MKKQICSLCGTTGSQVAYVLTNNQFGYSMDIEFCSNCECYFARNMPDKDFLETFYEDEYFADSRESTLRYALKAQFAAMRASSQNIYLRRFSHKPGSVLEVGSADGTFLSYLKKTGWDITGLEFNHYMVKKALDRFDIVLQPRDIFSIFPDTNSYDCIVMLHVIEHMPDPVGVLRHCRTLLNAHGMLFLEVPYSPRPDEVNQQTLSFYLSTTHLTNYRPRSLRLLVEKAGFHVVNVERYFYPIPSLFGSMSRDIGQMLMNGSIHTYHAPQLAALGITVGRMLFNRVFSDPFESIDNNNPWMGVGDSLRIIAKI